jgi:hypothetical protein
MTTETVSPSFPVEFDVEYPERLSRLLIFFKWLLIIPNAIVLYVVGIVAGLFTFLAWFAILFTGRYPRGMFNFVVGYYRWSFNLTAYLYLMRDEYPPFSLESGRYPLTFEVEYPEHLSRLLIFFKWLLVIPNIIVFYFVMLGWMVTTFIAWFAILFSGRFPKGLFNFSVGVLRWNARLDAYVLLLRDDYPPFSLK